jgi:hypothetical protein
MKRTPNELTEQELPKLHKSFEIIRCVSLKI